ncbi:MAG: hypothetical protein IJU52_09600 [Clostridia bacterium]|nr:hypothetical protein [Clostridia bacterium]
MFTVRLAGVDIAIDNKYAFVRRQCEGYESDGAPAFTVSASDDEIKAEWEGSLPSVRQTYPDPEGYGESVCIYRKICHTAPLYGVFLVHSAALCADGRAYLFSAPSGTGKTTHIRLWKKIHPDVSIINGDKPLLRRNGDGGFSVCGTPWSGKEGWHRNVEAPLGGVCFLERGEENRIRTLTPGEGAALLMKQIVYPQDPAPLLKTLELSDALVNSAPLYLLTCNISEEAAHLSYDTMTRAGAQGGKKR